MIRKANIDDVLALASMMHKMYIEVYPDYAVEDSTPYIVEVVKCIYDPKQTIFIEDDMKGFFIVVDETEAMTPELKVYNGTRVYIQKECRNGRVLKEFYDTIFDKYPDGDILGLTVITSEHIKVLDKRHTRVANLYKLKRN